MSEKKKGCQFCCWLRGQMLNLFMIVWFVFATGHMLVFGLFGWTLIPIAMSTSFTIGDVGRILIICAFHIAGLVWAGVHVLDLMKSCAYNNKY